VQGGAPHAVQKGEVFPNSPVGFTYVRVEPKPP
jgi:hypothetical protein